MTVGPPPGVTRIHAPTPRLLFIGVSVQQNAVFGTCQDNSVIRIPSGYATTDEGMEPLR